MFGFGKKRRKPRGLAFYTIGLFILALEALFGINAAFLVEQSVAIAVRDLLAGTPLSGAAQMITLAVSILAGICFVAGGMWTFAGFITNLEDAAAYEEFFAARWWPRVLVWSFLIVMLGLDGATLGFRASYFAQRGYLWLFLFFLIMIPVPFLLGALLHVLKHTPYDRQMSKVRRETEQRNMAVERSIVEEIDDDLLPDLLSDNPQHKQEAVNEHYRRLEAREKEQEDGRAAQQQRNQVGRDRRNSPLVLASRRDAS